MLCLSLKKSIRPSLSRAIQETLSRSEKRGIYDPLEPSIIKKYNLLTRTEALQSIHCPESFPAVIEAKKRLAFDELLCIQLVLLERRAKLKEIKGLSYATRTGDFKLAEKFINELDFSLTKAQTRVIQENTK